MVQRDDPLRELLRILEATRPEEINCDEFLARVGTLLEQYAEKRAPMPELEKMQQHLDICGQCSEEFDALLEVYGVSTSDSSS